MGEWEVANRRLRSRLAGDSVWVFSRTTCRFWKILDGMVVQDECVADDGGQRRTSGSYRIYDPVRQAWTVYWASTAAPELGLIRQVSGRVVGGFGDLLGEEEFEGRRVRLRYRWRRIYEREAYWEQAYFDRATGTWETNWIMELTRR